MCSSIEDVRARSWWRKSVEASYGPSWGETTENLGLTSARPVTTGYEILHSHPHPLLRGHALFSDVQNKILEFIFRSTVSDY